MFVLSPTRSPGATPAKWTQEEEVLVTNILLHSPPVLVNKVNSLSCGQPGVWGGGSCWNITKLAIIITYLTSSTTAPVCPRQHQPLITAPSSLTSPHHWLCQPVFTVHQTHLTSHQYPVSCHPAMNTLGNYFVFFNFSWNFFWRLGSSSLSPQKNIIYNYFPIRNSHQWQLLVFCPQCLLRHET